MPLYFRHMQLEEDVVLPAAETHLAESDCVVVDGVSAANADPLAGKPYREGFNKLFSLIATLTPAPLGVGPALKQGGAATRNQPRGAPSRTCAGIA